jgi:hypothetical protein
MNAWQFCASPSEISRPDYKRDQWSKHKDGYYTRYFAKGYQNVLIQVYVPEGLVDSKGDYLVFDPVSMLAIPANSNAQRLGIGAPVVIDIVRKVIQIERRLPEPKQLPENKPRTKTSKTGASK